MTTAAATIQLLLAIFRTIPAAKAFWDDLITAYFNAEIDRMSELNRRAIRKAIYDKDQRDIEKALTSYREGVHSGLHGTELRDDLPNVLPGSGKAKD